MIALVLALLLAQEEGAALFPSEFTLNGPASRCYWSRSAAGSSRAR
jgi:hypothetical protein